MKTVNSRFFFTIVVLSALGAMAMAADPPTIMKAAESKEARNARMKWWREARFGLIVSWGIEAIPAGVWQGREVQGTGSWIMNRGKIPVAGYAKLAKDFNPVKFDARQWVRLAKEAGARYFVLTCKSHDGFAMFRTKVTPYNVCDATPFGRDPYAEQAAACQAEGIELGAYYSQSQDWHHPGGEAAGGHWDPAQAGDFDRYLDTIAVPQVRELLTQYPVSVLWFDTPMSMTAERAAKFVPLFKLRPGLIVNNRLGHQGFAGDYTSPEQFIPATGFPGVDFEVCMTMNDTWAYQRRDHNWKTTETLIRNLIDIVSKGGNYLLSIGPNEKGEILPEPTARLKAFGRWMKVNSEAIHGTSASPFKRLAWGRCTQRPGKLYLHVFDWPADGRLVVPVKNKIVKATLLADPGRALAVTTAQDGTAIQVGATAPDPIASVVAVEIEGPVQPLAQVLGQDAAGRLELLDADAEIGGPPLQILGLGHSSNIFWMKAENTARWKGKITRPGTYAVRMVYACPPKAAGSAFRLRVGDHALAGKVAGTKSWDDFRPATLGKVRLKAGELGIALEIQDLRPKGLMNLRSIMLTPVD